MMTSFPVKTKEELKRFVKTNQLLNVIHRCMIFYSIFFIISGLSEKVKRNRAKKMSNLCAFKKSILERNSKTGIPFLRRFCVVDLPVVTANRAYTLTCSLFWAFFGLKGTLDCYACPFAFCNTPTLIILNFTPVFNPIFKKSQKNFSIVLFRVEFILFLLLFSLHVK